MYTVDKAGNASGCPDTRATDGANGGACTAAPPASGNLFARRTLALDPGQPQVTGVSPNNSYVGNVPAVFTLGSQNDLEVIDAKLRLLYPNLTEGDAAGTIPAAGTGGLVWTYALSGTFMSGSGGGSSISSGPAAGSTTAFGFFDPIAKRFDNSIINPSISPLTLDMFTTNVQETCTGTTGTATGPTRQRTCGSGTPSVNGASTLAIRSRPMPTDSLLRFRQRRRAGSRRLWLVDLQHHGQRGHGRVERVRVADPLGNCHGSDHHVRRARTSIRVSARAAQRVVRSRLRVRRPASPETAASTSGLTTS